VRGDRSLLRIGGYLIGFASRLLPGEIRDERYREWTAELPAILEDPDTRLAAHRAARMLGYAAGAVWGSALAAGGARGRLTAVMALVVGLLAVSSLMGMVLGIQGTAHGSGDWVHPARPGRHGGGCACGEVQHHPARRLRRAGSR
jgi:hypothetical protein